MKTITLVLVYTSSATAQPPSFQWENLLMVGLAETGAVSCSIANSAALTKPFLRESLQSGFESATR